MNNFFFYFWNNQFFRFLFIGGVNTLFGYSIFVILVFIKLHYSLALLFATILGVLFNFKTLGIVVFRNDKNSKIIKFFLVYAMLYFVNVFFVAGLKYLGMGTYSAGAFAVLPVAALGYVLNRKLVFNN